MMTTILEEISVKNTEKLSIYKLDTDQNPETSSRYNIMGVPSLLVFKNGREIQRMVGVRIAEMLQVELDKML